MTKRLFLALNLPAEIKAKLANLIIKLQKGNKNKPIKWVTDDNFHLTLHFLGDTKEERIPELIQKLEPIISGYQILNFQLSSKIDAFPNLADPKVIFLELKELNDGQTLKLQKQTGQALAELGWEINSRPFRLHLTLGRVKFKTTIQIPDFNLNISDFQVKTIDLMASQLTPNGPIYSVISSYLLKS
jgi:2'-5' RNA ligase